MKRFAYCLFPFIVLYVGQLHAGESCLDYLSRTLKCTRSAAVPFCCPDDYCRKPFPCVPCPPATTCGCYCRKPLPCVPCSCMSYCCDDYCRKPFPCYCWPVNRQFYRCPPYACKQQPACARAAALEK